MTAFGCGRATTIPTPNHTLHAARRVMGLSSHLRSTGLSKSGGVATMATASSSSGQVEVRHQKMQSVRLFLLNRPKSLNVLNRSMVNNIVPQLQVWEESNLCKVIVLTSVEGRAFCAGGDVKALVTGALSGKPEDLAEALKFFEEEYQLNHLIGTLKKPFISIMNGITMGGGVGLSVHAPFRIATENTFFAMPETGIGLFPDVGGSFFLPRLDGELGTFLGLTGWKLKGEEVFQAGIATHFIPSARLPSLLSRLAELETDELDVINGILEEFVGDIEPSKWNSWSLGGQIGNAIDQCFKFNTIEEIIAALEKENTAWAGEVLEELKKMSPTSLKVTLQQLRNGRKLDLASCFRMEYNMAREFLDTPDFYEGVRAKLIDKPSRTPKWQPPWEEMSQLSPSIVQRYFTQAAPSPRTVPKNRIPSEKLRFLTSLTYHDYPHRTLSGLPSVHDIHRVVIGEGRRGQSLAAPQTKEDVVEWLEQNWGAYDSGVIGSERQMLPQIVTIEGGFGRGKAGLREKVLSVLDRYVEEISKPGVQKRLEWKGPK
ncbi:hypothetical protein SpCBS45565_g07134 [Spizellomyces sp. 'palustris']|nr:hypothetical protein SpCBS45565_g07134 [Spizellomyces sp. 'palustris']